MESEISTRCRRSVSIFAFASRLAKNRDAAAVAAVFSLSLALGLAAAARTVTFSDSGDFLMGISTVGNVHGPGYPLYLMTAKLFGFLFPFGSIAFRASAYSAFFASVTACLVYLIVRRMWRSVAGGLVAGLAYAFSYTFWYQSVIPETYSLNAFFIALLILLALRWERRLENGLKDGAVNTMCLFALVLGLALSNHVSIIFLLPAFIFFAVDTDWRSALAPGNLLKMTAFLALGLLSYLYQPAAAFRGPAYNYGDPSTPVRWLRHVTAYYLREGLFQYPYLLLPGRLWRYLSSLTTEFPYSWWLAGVGLAASFRQRSRKYPLFLVLLFMLAAVPIMTYSQSEPVLRAHFYYPSYLVASIWLGIGTATVLKAARHWSGRLDRSVERCALAALVALAMLVPLAAALTHYRLIDKSGYGYAEKMARGMLTTARENAVILVDDDNVLFPLGYLQAVARLRPDVRVVSTVSSDVPGFQGADLRAFTPEGYAGQEGGNPYAQMVERNKGRVPLYTTMPNVVNFTWPARWLGLLVELFPGENARVGPDRQPPAGPRRITRRMDSDARWSVLLPEALRASVLYSRRDYEGAEKVYSSIMPAFSDGMYVPTLYGAASFAALHQFRGAVLNELGRFSETVRVLPAATSIDPDFRSVHLARAYASRGEYAGALEELDGYLAFFPADADALIVYAEVLLAIQEYQQAEIRIDRSIDVDPGNPRARLLKGVLLIETGRTEEARAEFGEAIRLDRDGRAAGVALDYLERLDSR